MSNEVIVAFITGVLGPVSIMIAKKLLSKKSNECMVEESLRGGESVLKKLEEIKETFKCDRVWICQFHNGGNFYPTGKSMTKFSMTYEVVGVSAHSIQSQFQNIPTSLFTRALKQLVEHDNIEIFDYKDETIATYGLKYVAELAASKSSYLFSIKTIDGKFVASLGVDYTKKRVKLEESEISQIKTHAATLSGVFMGKK